MRRDILEKLIQMIPREERRIDYYKEIPCKDFDYDCFGFDGRIPFGNYERCYNYAPEMGKCIFCEWGRSRQ